MRVKILAAIVMVCISGGIASGQEMKVAPGLFDYDSCPTLGLQQAPDAETFILFSPTDEDDHFCNGAVVASFKEGLYCMWQSSAEDEDSDDTWVAYSRSLDDGKTWCAPQLLYATNEGYSTSGGWIANDSCLVAFVNVWRDGKMDPERLTRYLVSTDGVNWSAASDVTMADGSIFNGIFEQDPHRLPSGRLINAAHFSPGLQTFPIWTDDQLGVSGWHRGDFNSTLKKLKSDEIEPSCYFKPNGDIVMIFRDQSGSFCKKASVSHDEGESWSDPVLTDFQDARTKQSAGNLADGTVYAVCSPVKQKVRIPLVVALSDDGENFDRAFLLQSQTPEVIYQGKAKRPGYHYPKSAVIGDYLYVAYTISKERVAVTRVPISSLAKKR